MQLDHDVMCLNCGYNLRGIDPTGTCPECGMSIAIALREDYLADAPESWRKKVRLGSILVTAGTLISFPLINFGVVIAAIGFWLLTTKQPQRTEPRHDMLVRIFSRATFVLGAIGLSTILHVIFVLLYIYQFRGSFEWRAYDSVFIGFGGLFGIGVAGMAQQLRTLCERMDNKKLIKHCQRLFWVWIISGLALVALGGGTNLYNYMRQPLAGYETIITVVMASAVSALFIWLWIETLILAWRFQRAVRKIA